MEVMGGMGAVCIVFIGGGVRGGYSTVARSLKLAMLWLAIVHL